MKLKSNVIIKILCVPLLLPLSNAKADQQFQDDVIVKGSICVGIDCVNGENFSFDTIRLKENNLRIRFTDTSSSSSFPTTDWQITVNDSANGGLNYFRIENIDGAKSPLTILDTAPNNAIYVTSNGVGFNTSTPLVNLHVKGGNSPALRLEQDGSSGFAAQTWDIAGNETNFFVRDVTNSSKIPFKIRPSAPNNSLYIDSDGGIGFETSTPDGLFDIAHPSNANNHAVLVGSTGNFGINIDNGFNPEGLFDVQTTGGVSRFTVKSDGSVGVGTNSGLSKLNIEDDQLPSLPLGMCGPIECSRYTGVVTIEESDESTTGRSLLTLKNNGPSWLAFENTNTNDIWNFTNGGSSFSLGYYDSNLDTLRALFSIDSSGNLSVPGTINGGSSLKSKTDISEVNYSGILKLLTTLPISSWRYISDKNKAKHIGPISEEFYAHFGIGTDEQHISPLDVSGVALASIKALLEDLRKSQLELKELKARVAKIESEE